MTDYPGTLEDYVVEQTAERCETSPASAKACLRLAMCERSQLMKHGWRLPRSRAACPAHIAEGMVLCAMETVGYLAGE